MPLPMEQRTQSLPLRRSSGKRASFGGLRGGIEPVLPVLPQVDILRCDLTTPYRFQRLRNQRRLILPTGTDAYAAQPNLALVNAIVRARTSYERIVADPDTTLCQLAKSLQVNERHVRRLLPYAFLSPDLVQKILLGANHRVCP